jgi:hypothetical protein
MGFPFDPVGAGLVYNVKSYGAFGDGVHDDMAAIQAAATAAGGGGVTFIPPGRYKTTSPILLSSGVSVIGTPASIIDYSSSIASEGAFYTPGNGNNYGVYSQISVRNLQINAYDSPALAFYGIDNLVIENVKAICTGATYPAELIILGMCRQSAILGNSLYNAKGDSIFMIGCYDYSIVGNSIYNSGDDGIYVGWTGTTPQSHHVAVVGNTLDTGGANGIRMEGSHVAVAGNTITGFTANGVIVDTEGTYNTDDVTVTGNTIDTCEAGGVEVTNSTTVVSGIRIMGNVVRGCGFSAGSSVYGGVVVASPTVVESNTVINCGSSSQGIDAGGILLSSGANNATVRNNRIEDSPGWSLVVWNGSGMATYTGVLIEDNDIRIGNTSGFNIGVSTGVILRNNAGYNPVGSSVPGTAFSLPASGTTWTNQTGVDGTLYVTGAGVVTDVVVQGVTVASSLSVGQSYFVPAGGTITFTYSSAPTLVFVGD